MKQLLVVAFAVMLVGCETSYKVAPTAAKVQTKVATAKQATKEAQKRTVELEVSTRDTQKASVTTSEHIESALRAMGGSDYVTAAQELVLAKASNELVQSILNQSYRNIASLGESLRETESNLGDAEQEIVKLETKVAKVVEQGAKDRAVVEQVNWGFGLGAFIYGIKRILTFGFFGVLGLVVILIVLLAIGGPCAIFALKAISWLVNLIRRK